MIIEVTQEDIDEGIPRSLESCAVAQAVARVYPDRSVIVDDEYIEVFSEEQFLVADTSKPMERFIKQFDLYQEVEPRRFRVTFKELPF